MTRRELASLLLLLLLQLLLLAVRKGRERKKVREREGNPIYNRFFNKVVVIVFLFTGL